MLMNRLQAYLAQYAAYHRDKRNLLTHFVGIPMIVLAIGELLSLPRFFPDFTALTPALLLTLLACVFYLWLDIGLGLIMCLWMGGSLLFAQQLVELSGDYGLMIGIGLFVVGWVFQFIGHYFEGRKPAFVDDIVGLLIGPLFIAVELLYLLGCYSRLYHQVEDQVGPLR